MKVMKAIAGLVSIMITLPIWFYLFYQVLIRVNASELMFFLFWVYVPSSIFIAMVVKISEND